MAALPPPAIAWLAAQVGNGARAGVCYAAPMDGKQTLALLRDDPGAVSGLAEPALTALLEHAEPGALLVAAAALRDAGHGRLVSYSRNSPLIKRLFPASLPTEKSGGENRLAACRDPQR